jgi:hypothetical protein
MRRHRRILQRYRIMAWAPNGHEERGRGYNHFVKNKIVSNGSQFAASIRCRSTKSVESWSMAGQVALLRPSAR